MGGLNARIERRVIPRMRRLAGIREPTGIPESGKIGPDGLPEIVDRAASAEPQEQQHRGAGGRTDQRDAGDPLSR